MGQEEVFGSTKTIHSSFCSNSKANVKIKLILFCFFLFTCHNHYAQDVAPLKLDNIWVYNLITYKVRISIIDTNHTIDTIKYFTQLYSNSYSSYLEYLRLNNEGYYVTYEDTSYPAPNNERLYYKKNAVKGDTWIVPRYGLSFVYTVLDTVRQSVFGQEVTVKYLEIDSGLILLYEWWTEEFGNLASQQFPFTGFMHVLDGCVIDGVVYGDTAFVTDTDDGIEQINDFTLEQNYPNPFNPETKIEYNISTAGNVQLSIYNSIGEEIIKLLNEWHISGKYSVEFQAKDLPSGVYFYRIQLGNKSIIKKMMLVK
jgi:hypothetical protein